MVSEREKALALALGECLEFLVCEQGWECFRAEFLYHDDKPKQASSAENARELRNFLSSDSIKPFVRELCP